MLLLGPNALITKKKMWGGGTVAIRRKALQPFTFSKGGPHIAVGEIACVSAWDIMHNEEKYPAAHQFDGHRFINNKNNDYYSPTTLEQHLPSSHHDGNMIRGGTRLTDASQDFPIWGYGSKVW